MDWLYSYFGTPLQLRFRKFDAGQLIERLVRVALPVGIDCGYYEKRLTDVAPPASESKAEVAKEKEGQQQQCVGSNDVKEGEVFAEGSGWDEDLEFDISLDDDDNNNNGANNHAGGSKAVEAEGKQETQSLDSQDGGAVETGGDGWDVDVDLDLDLELDEGTTAESNEKEATLRPQDKKGSKDANAGNGGNGWDTDVDLDFDLDDGEDDDGEGAVNADGDSQHHPHRTQPADDGNAPCSATAEEHIISAAAPTIVAGAENARSSDRSSSDTYYNPMSDKCCQTLTVLASNPHLATSPRITRLLLLQTYLVG
ncbi:hypothetical protein EV182_003648 [Spiromyces aspiralis]|uniref:Uncharacterized protein n=1 Tax=Spiromyces aspiralis TaxID=68401 RepID=A0ACC1HW92_9FUNG|nr:hypothetical protein EV182_003648 [Spiromyces aspiralis]